MAKNKTSVKKNCPFCGIQVAVASKNCPKCNHSFYQAKRISLGLVSDPSTSSTEDTPCIAGSSRRTSRVKREKPNYYDASEFEKKTKKKRNSNNPRGRPPNNPQQTTQGLKTRKKKKHHKITRDVEDEDEPIVLNAEKLLQCSIILAELNRKFVVTTFRV